jgi:membrane-associated phospholipid phosphatase
MSAHPYTAEMAAVRPARGAARPLGPARPLAIAGLCLLAMAAVWSVAAFVPAAHVRDAVLLHDMTLLNRPGLETAGMFTLDLLSPVLFVIWALVLVTVALVRRRPRVAVAVAVVMGLAPLTAETLKPLLAQSHAFVGGVYISAASWPSGHATAAMILVLCAILVSPARLRPLVAVIGLAFTALVGVLLLILAWHMPSDVIGGYVLAIFWASTALAVVRGSERRWPSRSSIAARRAA